MTAFNKILRHSASEEDTEQIEKDLSRTYPECPTFANNALFRHMLRSILVAYSIYDSEMGYVQGINMIVSVMLYHIKNPEQTFWAFVDLMEDQ